MIAVGFRDAAQVEGPLLFVGELSLGDLRLGSFDEQVGEEFGLNAQEKSDQVARLWIRLDL